MDVMPEKRISVSFGAAGLINHAIDLAFTIKVDGESMPVVMGMGRMRF